MAASYPTLQKLSGLLAADNQLSAALPEAQRLARLNRLFAGVMPPAVCAQCAVAALQGDTALVYCGNGAAASRVRAQAKTLARALSQRAHPVEAVRVKVRADWARPARAEKPGLTSGALAAFRALDGELPQGALKGAVERLLSRRS